MKDEKSEVTQLKFGLIGKRLDYSFSKDYLEAATSDQERVADLAFTGEILFGDKSPPPG